MSPMILNIHFNLVTSNQPILLYRKCNKTYVSRETFYNNNIRTTSEPFMHVHYNTFFVIHKCSTLSSYHVTNLNVVCLLVYARYLLRRSLLLIWAFQ